MKSRLHVRSLRKSIKNRKSKKGGGFFTKKTLDDNRRNCLNYNTAKNQKRLDYQCDDKKHLKSTMYPGYFNRMMDNKGTQIGTSTLGL
uniref:Uncharacterized protein n=1 Tax=viral metagenome TaxID=1070528 RepID=A0A6C0BA24_9ZZZZ